jgi:hypothetical protein
MSEIFTDCAFDLGFDIDNETLIPVFTDYINSFASDKNLDPSCIENYIKLGGNLLDVCCAYRYGNGDLMCEQFGESAAIYACKENDNRFLEMLQKYNYSNFNAILFPEFIWIRKIIFTFINSTLRRSFYTIKSN